MKKLLSFLLALCLCLSVMVTASAKIPTAMGDVETDEVIDATDALRVLQHAVGKRTIYQNKIHLADTDGDGSVDAADALLILQKAVGKIRHFPAEKTAVNATVNTYPFNAQVKESAIPYGYAILCSTYEEYEAFLALNYIDPAYTTDDRLLNQEYFKQKAVLFFAPDDGSSHIQHELKECYVAGYELNVVISTVDHGQVGGDWAGGMMWSLELDHSCDTVGLIHIQDNNNHYDFTTKLEKDPYLPSVDPVDPEPDVSPTDPPVSPTDPIPTYQEVGYSVVNSRLDPGRRWQEAIQNVMLCSSLEQYKAALDSGVITFVDDAAYDETLALFNEEFFETSSVLIFQPMGHNQGGIDREMTDCYWEDDTLYFNVHIFVERGDGAAAQVIVDDVFMMKLDKNTKHINKVVATVTGERNGYTQTYTR